jgi:alkylresorcinol/alkylpyrone synthase
MSELLSLETEELEYRVSASETKEFLASLLPPTDVQRFQRLVDASRIHGRRALTSLHELRRWDTLEARNAVYGKEAIALGQRVGLRALTSAGLEPREIDVILVTSSTGHLVPTLDQHLVGRLGLRPDVRCIPLSGLGCAGAVRAMALAADLFAGKRTGASALVISVELCSLWLQVAEPSPEDVLSNMLFGDGAGATVIGSDKSGQAPELVASHTALWPESLEARGARLTATGFRHFSSAAIPRLLRANLRRTVEEFLFCQGVNATDLRFYAINPSDHRILETVGSILGLPEPALRPAWATWEQHGNTLSAGPLYVLQALEAFASPADRDLGLVLVFGPGITCEMLLLRWHGGLNRKR